MIKRALLLSLCFVVAAWILARATTDDAVPSHPALSSLPFQVAAWQGQPVGQLDERVLAALNVDEYVNRVYVAPDGSAVGLYIGYYRSQREGTTMHSPLNCLPGAGWQPVARTRLALAGGGVINRLTIEKGLDRQVVLYWYQSHARVEASEYWGKFYTVLDAIRSNRTDAALVRIIAPVAGNGYSDERAAERAAVQFATALSPLLSRFFPD